MTDAETIDALRNEIAGLHGQLVVQSRAITALDRQNRELRNAIDALMRPSSSELLARNLAHPSRQ